MRRTDEKLETIIRAVNTSLKIIIAVKREQPKSTATETEQKVLNQLVKVLFKNIETLRDYENAND